MGKLVHVVIFVFLYVKFAMVHNQRFKTDLGEKIQKVQILKFWPFKSERKETKMAM